MQTVMDQRTAAVRAHGRLSAEYFFKEIIGGKPFEFQGRMSLKLATLQIQMFAAT